MRKIMRTSIPLLIIATTACMFTGCIRLEQEYPDKRHYLIDVEHPPQTVSRTIAATLKVRKFRVSPRYENREFVYRQRDLQYEAAYYHNFFIAPPAMLTEETIQWLADSGLFQQVVDSSSHLASDYILEGRVPALYGDFRDNKDPKAVLEIQFFLLDETAARSEVVFQKNIRRAVSIEKATPQALVNGWNQAMREILIELEQHLAELNLSAENSN